MDDRIINSHTSIGFYDPNVNHVEVLRDPEQNKFLF